MSTHTPGAWFFDADDNTISIAGDEALSICSLVPVDRGGRKSYFYGPTTEANAHLIAAAPYMLQALRRAVLALAFAAESSEAMRDDYEAVCAAIARAIGEPA